MSKNPRNIKIVFTFFLTLAWSLFLLSWVLFAIDVLFCNYTSPLTLSQWLFFFLHCRLPFQLPLIVYAGTRIKSNLWQKIFAWQTWMLPVSLLASISILVWQFNPTYLYQTALLGFKWNWIAVLTWNILFILQLYLYQKGNTQNFVAFTLSYLGVFLGSFLYEIPFFIKTGGISNSTFLIIYIISFIVFAWILAREKLKFNLWNLMFFSPIILIWIFYFDLPIWIHRLSVFPFFLSLSVTNWRK